MLTPKQPVINAVLITYIDYSITENYIGKMASFRTHVRSRFSKFCITFTNIFVAQLKFLREWKLSDRRLYEVFERGLLI